MPISHAYVKRWGEQIQQGFGLALDFACVAMTWYGIWRYFDLPLWVCAGLTGLLCLLTLRFLGRSPGDYVYGLLEQPTASLGRRWLTRAFYLVVLVAWLAAEWVFFEVFRQLSWPLWAAVHYALPPPSNRLLFSFLRGCVLGLFFGLTSAFRAWIVWRRDTVLRESAVISGAPKILQWGVILFVGGSYAHFYAPSYKGNSGAKVSSVKGNMHTLQTMVETYAVNWDGAYPPSFEALSQDAHKPNKPGREYWEEFSNPYTGERGFGKSFQMDSLPPQKGIVTYALEPLSRSGRITRYWIYGYNRDAWRIRDRSRDFSLTNSR